MEEKGVAEKGWALLLTGSWGTFWRGSAGGAVSASSGGGTDRLFLCDPLLRIHRYCRVLSCFRGGCYVSEHEQGSRLQFHLLLPWGSCMGTFLGVYGFSLKAHTQEGGLHPNMAKCRGSRGGALWKIQFGTLTVMSSSMQTQRHESRLKGRGGGSSLSMGPFQ